MKKINKYFCYVFFVVPIVLFLFSDFTEETDIWFLLSHGRYVLNHGFPHVEFLTMHEGLHFVMQQWLSSILFYVIYKHFGVIGIYFLVWFFFAIIMYLVYKLCMKVCGDIYLSCVFSTITLSLLARNFITCRPNTISIIIFLVLLIIMEGFYQKKSKKIYLLVLLSLLEINLHAAMWPILFILLLPFLADYFIKYLKKKDKTFITILFVMLLMFLVGFINPYGWEAMTYSIRSYGVSEINDFVWEMRALNFGSQYDYVRHFSLLVYIVIVGVSVILIKSRKKVDYYILFLIFGTYLMALMNIRNVMMFLICSLPFCTKYIPAKTKYSNANSKIYNCFYLVLMCSIIMFGFACKDHYILQDEKSGQKEILQYLDKQKKNGNIGNIYASSFFGGYFSFHGYKNYIDSRAEVFLKRNNHKEDIYKEYYLEMYEELSYSDFLNRYKFKYLVVAEDEYLLKYLQSSENTQYKYVFNSKKLYLFEKKD